MNRVIKDIAVSARADVGQLFAEMLCTDSEVNVQIAEAWNVQPTEVRTRIFNVVSETQERFARLVYERCIQVIEDNIPEVDNPRTEDYWDIGYQQAMKDCIHHIREHFEGQ